MIPSPRKLILLIAAFLLVFAIVQTILFVALFQHKQEINKNRVHVLPTTAVGQTTNTSYTLSLPHSWQLEKNATQNDSVKRYTFMVDNQSYSFQSFPKGSIPIQAPGADTIVDQAKIFQGRQFLIRTYMKQNQPLLIIALPNEADLSIDGFMMALPATNTQIYINQFEQLLQTMQFPNPASATPMQPLVSSGTYTISQ